MLLYLCYHPMGNLHTPEIVAAAAAVRRCTNFALRTKGKKSAGLWRRNAKSCIQNKSWRDACNNGKKYKCSAYLPVSRRQFSLQFFFSFALFCLCVALCVLLCVCVSQCPFCLLCSLIWSDKYCVCWNRNRASGRRGTKKNNTRCSEKMCNLPRRAREKNAQHKSTTMNNMYLSAMSSLCRCLLDFFSFFSVLLFSCLACTRLISHLYSFTRCIYAHGSNLLERETLKSPTVLSRPTK